MASTSEDFSMWLSNKLKQLNIDENVFGSYIQGILDSDESPDEKTEALQGILIEFIENADEIGKICDEILDKWQFHRPKEPPPTTASSVDVDRQLVKLLESQSLQTTKQKKYTEEEKKIRDAILSQYSQMTDDEDDGIEQNNHPVNEHKENDLEKNTNVQAVLLADKAKREQAKLDSQRKKEKDKEDREKQKQLREEKKEKRKTQKGERRR